MLDILHTESSTGWGGQEARTLLESEHLIRRGHRVRIAAPPGSGIEREALRRNIPVFAVPMRSVVDPAAYARLVGLLRRDGPAILHTHSSKDSWLGALAAKQTRVPVLLRTRHVSIPAHSHRFNPIYSLPDRVIVTASATREHLIRQFRLAPERVTTIPTGVDLRRFGPGREGLAFRKEFGLGPVTPAVGMVAQLRGSKGHDCFIEAARLLAGADPDIRFFIVGDGLWRDLITEKIRAEGMSDRILMTGYREDVPEIMGALDILVIASTRTDGIPQAGLQALASGLPVVGTRVGGIPEIVREGETGALVQPGDPKALADAIRELLADPARRKAMGRRGAEMVRRRYSLEAMLDALEALYGEALRESRRNGR